METAGRLVTLLGPQGAGKTDALLALSGLMSLPAVDGRLASLVDGSLSISLCSTQRLAHSYLTVRENVRLMAALHGITARARVDELLQVSTLSANRDETAYSLPRHLSRKLNLVWALLPDTDVLLVDDLTRGLSMPAQRQLCRFILEEQQRRPRVILFATRELHVAQTLGGEVWLFDRGQAVRQWQPGELPENLFRVAAYHIELKNPSAARSFSDDLTTQAEYVRDTQWVDSRTVRVVVNQAANLLDLVQTAGRNLINFHSLPVGADYLLARCRAIDDEGIPSAPAMTVSAALGRTRRAPERRRVSLPRWQVVWQLALAEWRTHFRRAWQFGNLIFSSLLLLIALQLAAAVYGEERLMLWLPVVLLLFSGLAFGFAMESVVRLTQVADNKVIFQPAQVINPSSRLSLLALYDLAPIGRVGVLSGLAGGQVFILLCHALIPLASLAVGLSLFTSGWGWIVASVAYWLFTTIDSLALAVLVGRFVRRPNLGLGLGGLFFLFVTFTIVVAPFEQPLIWLWPYAGFTAAFRGLSTDPAQACAALGIALLGTLFLCTLALRTFRRQQAVYVAQ